MENKVRIALSSLFLLAAVLIKGSSEVFVSNNSLDQSSELPSIKCVWGQTCLNLSSSLSWLLPFQSNTWPSPRATRLDVIYQDLPYEEGLTISILHGSMVPHYLVNSIVPSPFTDEKAEAIEQCHAYVPVTVTKMWDKGSNPGSLAWVHSCIGF